MKASVRERKLLDIEADPELSRLLIPPELGSRTPGARHERPDASRNSSDSLGGAIACEATMRNRSISGSPARNCVRGPPSEPTSSTWSIRASPLPIPSSRRRARPDPRHRQAVADIGRSRRCVGPSNATLPSRNSTARSQRRSTAAASCETNTIVASALLELEDLAEALALELLVPNREDLVQ